MDPLAQGNRERGANRLWIVPDKDGRAAEDSDHPVVLVPEKDDFGPPVRAVDMG